MNIRVCTLIIQHICAMNICRMLTKTNGINLVNNTPLLYIQNVSYSRANVTECLTECLTKCNIWHYFLHYHFNWLLISKNNTCIRKRIDFCSIISTNVINTYVRHQVVSYDVCQILQNSKDLTPLILMNKHILTTRAIYSNLRSIKFIDRYLALQNMWFVAHTHVLGYVWVVGIFHKIFQKVSKHTKDLELVRLYG